MRNAKTIALVGLVPLAWIGALWLFSSFAFTPLAGMLVRAIGGYEETFGKPLVSPNGKYVARTMLVRGGFGTVWDERLIVHRSSDDPDLHRAVLGYSDRGIEFTFQWVGAGNLEVDVPCGAYEHARNSIDEDEKGRSLGWVILRNTNRNCEVESVD